MNEEIKTNEISDQMAAAHEVAGRGPEVEGQAVEGKELPPELRGLEVKERFVQTEEDVGHLPM